jgi:alpha-L-arabinofuranosidase
MSPEWFRANAARYDKYPRKGPKVFAGEYAAHGKNNRNNFEGALAEAAFMTGLERNADVVQMATYAPLFSHVEGWQWKPDLIWFDNLRSFRTPNWYVQQLYSLFKGTHVLSLTENKLPLTGQEGLYASAVIDKAKGQYYVKIANVSDKEQSIILNFKDLKSLTQGEMTIFHAADKAENSIEKPTAVVPKTQQMAVSGNRIEVKVGAKTFAVVQLQ